MILFENLPENMSEFTAWCISQHIDEQRFKQFIKRMYISPNLMMTNVHARELAWREYLVNYYADKAILWQMINQMG